jgi:hypothetical protein
MEQATQDLSKSMHLEWFSLHLAPLGDPKVSFFHGWGQIDGWTELRMEINRNTYQFFVL